MTENKAQLIVERSKQSDEPELLLNKRQAAFEQFQKKQMPNFVYGLNINLSVDLDLDTLNPEQSKSIKAESSSEYVNQYDPKNTDHNKIIEEKFMTTCVPADDKFTLFHQAFVNNIRIITIPKGVVVKEPIEIQTTISNQINFIHTIIICEEGSEATIVEHAHSDSNDATYLSKIVEIFMEPNAKLDYGNVQLLDANATQFTIKRANIGKDARVNWLDCCFGSKVTLSEVTAHLNEPGAETNNFGIFFGNGNQQFDLVTQSIHNAPNTMSDIFTKGALTGGSKCLYRGLVKIGDNAPNSNGYQHQDTLLLSKDAAADSIPNLEIDNSEVKCSHGATIGKIDPEKLFYIQSRGLSLDQATQEYVKAYFEPLILKMPIKDLQEKMHDLVEERMHAKKPE